MVYQATQDVVRRVLPLLEQLAQRSIDKARLLQYLAARSGVDWGVLDFVAMEDDEGPAAAATERVLVVRDPITGQEHRVRYPACLPEAIEPMVRAEYQRLAKHDALSVMAPDLFAHLFAASHCESCAWRGPQHAQIHRECHYAGRPINYEPSLPPRGGPLAPPAG